MDTRLFAEWVQIDEHLRRVINARERRFSLAPALIRQLIQRRLWDGRLSNEKSAERSLGPGTGDRCDGCGFSISRYQLMTVRIDAQDWRDLQFHKECFEIWDEERVKNAQTRPSHSR